MVNNTVLYQPIDGYCYNSDTHFLFQFIHECFQKYKNISGELLDIGSGSGILGILVKRDFEKLNLSQCEIQDTFQFLSQKNVQCNNLQSTLFKGDFSKIDFDKKFDLIVSNPPFYHAQVIKSLNENIKIARYNDSLPLENFIKKVSQVLNNNGKFLFCYDAKQLDVIVELCEKQKLNIEAVKFLHPKVSKEATLVMIMMKKNSKSLMKILPPFIMFEEDGEFTKNTLEIYDRCATHSIKAEVTL